VSTGQTDVSRGWTDTLNVSNSAVTDGMSWDEGAGTYLGAGGANRVVNATNGVRRHADASTGPMDVPSVDMESINTAYATQNVSIPRKREKPPDSPMETAKCAPDESNGLRDHAGTSNGRTDASCIGNATKTTENASETVRPSQNEQKLLNLPMETAKRHPDEPNGCGSRADGSSARMHAYCAGNGRETAENETESIRTRRIGPRTQDSPETHETATPKLPSRWKRVSAGDGDVYVPQNAPVVAIETANRIFAFGEVESGDEPIAASVEGERAGDGDGGRNGDVGDVDGTTSGGDADSMRVEAVLLAAESQYTRYSSRSQRNDLPMSSRPPILSARRPYGLVRRRRRRGRLKIERINISQTPRVKTTHLDRACAMQPPGNAPNHAYGIYRPRRRRGRIKIAPRNVSRTQTVGTTHLGRVNAIRSKWRPKKQIRRFSKLTFEYRKQGEPRRRDDGEYG